MFVVVKRYGYRTAWVTDTVLVIPSFFMEPLRKALALAAGTTPDNHEVYEVNSDRVPMFIGFSDFSCYIGLGIRVENNALTKEVNEYLPEIPGSDHGAKMFAWLDNADIDRRMKEMEKK